MKVILFGKYNRNHIDFLKKNKINIVKTKGDFVIVFGGDGSLMQAELKYPFIPKVAVRQSRVCKKCLPFPFEEIVNRLINKKYQIENLYKLDAVYKNRIITGINDVVIHNSDPRHALRYIVKINKIDFYGEIIGDGIVASTIFGASGYFRSITDSVFYVGIGIAFNNSTEATDHLVINENDIIDVEIKRGPAQIYADNNLKMLTVKEGDRLSIKKSEEIFRLVKMI